MPEGSETGPLSQAFVDEFQACINTTADVTDTSCVATTLGFYALTGCGIECISEVQRGRNTLCRDLTSTECETTATKPCVNYEGADGGYSATLSALLQRLRAAVS